MNVEERSKASVKRSVGGPACLHGQGKYPGPEQERDHGTAGQCGGHGDGML